MAPSRDIILYHYSFSPYARRIVWYLQLRKIPYSECLQPPIMPRPALTTLSISYRRIPILSIGRDIYLDTRLIISKLETLFPPSTTHPPLSSASADSKAFEKLLEYWVDGYGVFSRGSQLIHPDAPLMRDKRFRKDREQMSGRSWSLESQERGRPEAVVETREAFRFLEEGLLADGRQWITGTEGMNLADLEAVWPLHWVTTLPSALPPDQISSSHFPRVFAWIARFQALVRAAKASLPKPISLTGEQAKAQILNSEFAEKLGGVDDSDPSGLKEGETVEVFPIDSGSANRDRGRLINLDGKEIVWETETEGEKGMVRVHAPRHGFRVKTVGDKGRL